MLCHVSKTMILHVNCKSDEAVVSLDQMNRGLNPELLISVRGLNFTSQLGGFNEGDQRTLSKIEMALQILSHL